MHIVEPQMSGIAVLFFPVFNLSSYFHSIEEAWVRSFRVLKSPSTLSQHLVKTELREAL